MPQDEVPRTPAAAELLKAVRLLHIRADLISTRKIAKEAGHGQISHNTVSKVLKTPYACKQTHLLLVVRVLGGDEKQFSLLWEQAKLEEIQPRPPQANQYRRPPDPPASPVDDHDTKVTPTGSPADNQGHHLPGPAHLPTTGGDLDTNVGPAVTSAVTPTNTSEHPPRRPPTAQHIAPYPNAEHRPVADELFLIGHDRRRGKPVIGKHLALGLAGAALGELLLAQAIDIAAQRITVLRRLEPSPDDPAWSDPVTGYFLRELADEKQRQHLSLYDWVKGTAEETCRRVAQRLAEARIIEREHRPLRGFYYPRTPGGHHVAPDVRVTRYLLDNLTPPDLQTRFLIALICAISGQKALGLDLKAQQLEQRMRPTANLLPAGMQDILTAIEKAIWGNAMAG